MKKILIAGVLLGVSAAASAEVNVGMGVSLLDSDSTTVYVPIDINKQIRIEPTISLMQSEDELGSTKIENEAFDLGAGVFFLMPTNHSVTLYVGGRVSFVSGELKTTVYAANGTVLSTTEVDRDGFRIAPTVGFEYNFNDHISLGGEAGIGYSDIDDSEYTGTTTNVIFRYRF
jgi:hypothetical protein